MKKAVDVEQIFHEQIIAQYPEQVDYWLHKGNAKHTAILLKMKCPHCNFQETIPIKNKIELRRLFKKECSGCIAKRAAENQHLDIRIYFGKFKGKTINFIMEKQPNYLAWFVDNIRGQDDLIEQIKTHTQFPQAWAEYTEKQALMPKAHREEIEWRAGRFSQQTLDDLCNSLSIPIACPCLKLLLCNSRFFFRQVPPTIAQFRLFF